MTISGIIGGILMLCGAAFLLLAGIGLVRMPDLFNRIQAGTKATTLGTLLTLAGAACLRPEWTLKLLLIGLFILLTNPISSQVLARAAHRTGTPKTAGTVDRLADDREERP
ncbi:MAG TPA: monovalent cation/H(+) antiporter subunit G [bacterium]|nr:monovalent cation/H(+) antiporter subunit G [bacterium]